MLCVAYCFRESLVVERFFGHNFPLERLTMGFDSSISRNAYIYRQQKCQSLMSTHPSPLGEGQGVRFNTMRV
jgi:hypothetical protein